MKMKKKLEIYKKFSVPESLKYNVKIRQWNKSISSHLSLDDF